MGNGIVPFALSNYLWAMQITAEHIIDLCEERYRERGMQILRDGMVELLKVTDTKATAKCLGTRMYKVELELDDGKLVGECTCPAFEDFGPCKHMAAVAHAVRQSGYEPSEQYEDEKEEAERIERHLMKKSKSQLVSMIMQVIYEDPELQWMIERELEE